MSDPTTEEIDASLDRNEKQRATCPVCHEARERFRASCLVMNAVLTACCGLNPDKPRCPACAAASEARSNEGLREIHTFHTHPHSAEQEPTP